MGKKLTVLIMLISLLFSICACTQNVAVKEDSLSEEKFQKNKENALTKEYIRKKKEDLLSEEQMQKDLETITSWLKHHPMFYLEEDKNDIYKQELMRLSEEFKKPKTKTEFFFEINKMLVALGDAHTRITYPHEQDMFINLPFRWLKNGVYINKKTSEFKVGDKITKIGDKTISQIFEYALSVFPHENKYRVEYLCEKYVKHYFFLNYFGLIDSDLTVAIEYESNGKNKKCKLKFQQPVTDSENKLNINWNIDEENDVGYLRYDKCYFTDESKNEHLKFFKQVNNSGVKNIVIDLRYNTGGYLENMVYTIDFLKNVDSFWSYRSKHVDTFKDPPAIIESKWNSEKAYMEKFTDDDIGLEFEGNLYVLIDNNTFSAANMCAFVLRDNGFATLVGEPSGNKPTSYSCIRKVDLTESGFVFKESKSLVQRTDKSKTNDIALFPDIEVYTTGEDLKQGRDPQLEKVYELIKSK